MPRESIEIKNFSQPFGSSFPEGVKKTIILEKIIVG